MSKRLLFNNVKKATVITYNITYELTDVTLDNNITTIQERQSYTANITVSDGYEISTIRILMNTVDITDTVYTNNIITINEVVGDIEIIVVAEKAKCPLCENEEASCSCIKVDASTLYVDWAIAGKYAGFTTTTYTSSTDKVNGDAYGKVYYHNYDNNKRSLFIEKMTELGYISTANGGNDYYTTTTFIYWNITKNGDINHDLLKELLKLSEEQLLQIKEHGKYMITFTKAEYLTAYLFYHQWNMTNVSNYTISQVSGTSYYKISSSGMVDLLGTFVKANWAVEGVVSVNGAGYYTYAISIDNVNAILSQIANGELTKDECVLKTK